MSAYDPKRTWSKIERRQPEPSASCPDGGKRCKSHMSKHIKVREGVMAIETDLAHQNERVLQAANFGWIWARECAEESINQSKRAFKGFRHVTRKMVEDRAQAVSIREQTTEMTEKILSNTLEFGQKFVRAKGPLEFTQCQNEFMARQAQTIADQTREFRNCSRQRRPSPATHRARWPRQAAGARRRFQTSPLARHRPRGGHDHKTYATTWRTGTEQLSKRYFQDRPSHWPLTQSLMRRLMDGCCCDEPLRQTASQLFGTERRGRHRR